MEKIDLVLTEINEKVSSNIKAIEEKYNVAGKFDWDVYSELISDFATDIVESL